MTDQENAFNEGEAEEVATGLDQDQLAIVLAERDQYLDQLQRSLADFANFRRRVEQERLRSRAVATRDVLTQVLPLVDDMQRALNTVPAEQLDAPWVAGMQLIGKKMQSFLDREGVEEIDALGRDFDPSVHEAVAVDPGSSEHKVVEVYQSGYRQGDELLRPAMVRVGDWPVA